MKLMIFVIANLINLARGQGGTTIQFIKKFIENEQKPTNLIYSGLCWKKSMEVRLAKEMSKLGLGTSESIETNTKYQEHGVLFLTDLNCQKAEDILLNATSKHLFRFPYRWLILTTSSEQSKLAVLRKIPALITSDLVLAERIGDQFTLVELHKPLPHGFMASTLRGFYNGNLTDVRPHRELFRRRRDVMGHPLTVANVIQDSNSTKYHLLREDRLELQNDAVAKVCWVFAKIAFEMINATPKYIFSYRWGYKVNGVWSGMIHDIGENKADLGTNCVLFKDRLDVITYMDLVAPMRMRFIFRQPPLTYISNIYALPFSSGVWIAIAVCSIASAVSLRLASIWEERMETNPTHTDRSIGDALFLTMSAVTQQGCEIELRRTPGRIMEWVMFAALMALYAAYCANIVVLLQAPSNSITSLAHLAAAKITLAANDLDYNRFVLNDSYDSVHASIHDTVMPENGKPKVFDVYEGTERIRQGLFAFHSIVEPVYRRIQDTFLESEKCDLAEADFINSRDSHTPVKKDSPFLELLKVVYKQIRESGVQAALNKRYQVTKPRCPHKTASFSSVGLLDIQPVLLLALYGLLLSLTIVSLEIIVFKMLVAIWTTLLF